MQDADEGTSFADVQTASVKRTLAQDSNNDKLHQSALMEMIGHLSKDNKEPYLKHSQPLQKYIDVKDEFDFKHNNYTTTKNIDTTPDENIRQLQRELNESGYTDKFGQPLKEDGIYAGKTAYANDSKKSDSVDYTNQRFGNRTTLPSRGQIARTTAADTYPVTNDDRYKTANVNGNEHQVQYLTATKDDLQPKIVDNSKVKLTSTNHDAKSLNNTPTYEELKKLMKDGTLSPGDEKRNPIKKTMLRRLSANWWTNYGNDENQKKISTIGDKLRKFDDNNFEKAYYLNKNSSAGTMGHNAIMLMNEDGYALVFSFYPQSENLKDTLNTNAEMRFSVLTPTQANRTLNQDGYIFSMSASDGEIKTENYNRYIEFDISNGQGYNMYYKAVNLYKDPGEYQLFQRQCDDIACEILNFGGIDIDAKNIPNVSFKHKENEILMEKIWKTIKDTYNELIP